MSYMEKREKLDRLTVEELIEKIEGLKDGGSGLVKEGLIDIILDVEGEQEGETEEGGEENTFYNSDEQELDMVDRGLTRTAPPCGYWRD